MRRSDITVGAELYYDTSQNWERYPSGWRVVVVDADKWRHRKRYPYGVIKDPVNGNGVLVDRYNHKGEVIEARVCANVAHLRGPYAETLAVVEAHQRARSEAEAAAKEQRLLRLARAQQIAAWARAEGFTSANPSTHYEGPVIISAADLERLLEERAAARNETRPVF